MGVNAYEGQEEGNISAAIRVTARLLLTEVKAEKRKATGLDGRLSSPLATESVRIFSFPTPAFNGR